MPEDLPGVPGQAGWGHPSHRILPAFPGHHLRWPGWPGL